jgi:hypothetical protein
MGIEEQEPSAGLLPEDWQSKLPPWCWLKSVAVIRPAFLNDGKCKAETDGSYRVDDLLPGAYFVSREDVSHFIAIECVPNWSKYENRAFPVVINQS